MSVVAVRWAAEQTAGGPMSKLVLLVLAEHANRDGAAHTSLATLVRDTEASRSTVVRALDTLTEHGLLARARRRRGTGADTSNEYRLRLDRIADRIAGSAAGGVTATPIGGGHRDTPGGQADTPPVSERHPGSVGQTPHAGVTVTPQCEPEVLNRTTEPSSVARPRTRGTTTTVAELSATAVRSDAYRLVSAWRTETAAGYRPATVRALAKHADGILRDGGDPAAVRAALDEWNRRPDARPGLLPYLYDDAVKARHNPGQTAVTAVSGGMSKRDAKAAGWFALAAELAAEDTGNATAVDVEVLRVDGGRS